MINDITVLMLRCHFESLINTILPIKEIIDILDYDESKHDDESKQTKQDDETKETEIKSIQDKTSQKLIIEKQPSENSLKYVSSNDFNNEYYKQESSHNEIEDLQQKLSDINMRHVHVPKFKKNKFFYNKPKINEFKENFFSE